MPSSNFGHLMDILSTISLIRPNSILEVGVGFGKYGFLTRELLDLKEGENGGYRPWEIRMDGIEICEKYITPVHEYIYNNIFIGNASDIMENLDYHYDCLVCVDVLEHFKKQEAYEFIEKCRKVADNIILCTPYVYYDQGEVFKNPHEAHYSAWLCQDFLSLGAKYIWICGLGLIAVFTNRELGLSCMKDRTFNDDDLKNMQLAISMYANTRQLFWCIDLCEIYLKYRPNDIHINIILALCYEQQRKYEMAQKYAIKVLEISPDSEMATKIIQRTQRAV